MTSDRMIRAAMREPHDSPKPISEQFRIMAKLWARLDGEARKLEAMRDPELAKRSKAVVAADHHLQQLEKKLFDEAKVKATTRVLLLPANELAKERRDAQAGANGAAGVRPKGS